MPRRIAVIIWPATTCLLRRGCRLDEEARFRSVAPGSSQLPRRCFGDGDVGSGVRRLRYAPPPWDLALLPNQKARIEEIEHAWKAHVDGFFAAEEAAGVNEAQDAIDHVADLKRTIVEEIAAVPAKTLNQWGPGSSPDAPTKQRD